VFKTSYRAIIHPDYYTQTFEGTGSTMAEARQSCENQLREVLNNLRQTSRVPVALVSFTCLDPQTSTPPLPPRQAVRSEPWQPQGGIRDSGIIRNLKSMLSR
jgi:hypothetical protein